MKKFLALIFSSALILGACGNDNTSNNDSDSKSENKTEKKSEDKKTKEDKKSKEEKKSQESEDNKSTEEQDASNVEEQNNENQSDNETDTQDNSSNEKSQNTQNVDVTNIKDRSTLESVIYGNYSETDKIQAYNNAVANGVIPQGNVMEGPASAAYESSLRVESGQEKSVYDNSNSSESTPGTDAGMIDYDEVDKQIEADRKAQEEKEAKLQKEYFDLSDKMFEEDVSDEEYEAMEKRQNEILDEVEPIN
ncbi:flagellum-specific peptidoglycan hydrolase FlgJ [Staphylococcus caledonicus]